MNNPADRRTFTRIPFRVQATIWSDHVTEVATEVRDISLRGLYVVGTGRIPPGTLCKVLVVLGGADSEVRLHMQGKVVRVDAGGMAVEFQELGLDTFIHLRNLIHYNSRDQSLIEEEFHAHLGLLPREANQGECP